ARAEAAGLASPQVAPDRRTGQRPGARRAFRGLGFRTTGRAPSTWQTALMLAGGAAFLSVGAAGVVLMEGPGGQGPSAELSAPAPEVTRAAVALSPQPLGPTAPQAGAPPPEAAAPAPPARDLAADYASAVRDVESGVAGGLSRLKQTADACYPPAEFYLAKLYETGV